VCGICGYLFQRVESNFNAVIWLESTTQRMSRRVPAKITHPVFNDEIIGILKKIFVEYNFVSRNLVTDYEFLYKNSTFGKVFEYLLSVSCGELLIPKKNIFSKLYG